VLPARTPAPVVANLNAAIRRALAAKSMQDMMSRLGNTPAGESPDAFAERIRTDLAAWGAIVKASGFTAEE
jgi:tripartite-type tricarboxylate transporter receptor subunit TctC